MSPFDEMPYLNPCPHCGHTGEGLQYAFPPDKDHTIDLSRVQAACLACGVHGPYRRTYLEAAVAFQSGQTEDVAA